MAYKFEALEVALQLAEALGEIIPLIARHDRDLAKQLKKAGTSVPSNFSEGAQRNGQDRLQHYRISGGSAAEVHTQLRVAVAWRYVSAERAAKSIDLADRAAALAWRLTHPR
jgi:four helix bundle protein